MAAERGMLRTVRRLGTIFIVNLAVLAFLILGFGREYLRNLEIERNIADMEAQNEELEGQKLESLSVIESLSSEYYLEGEARRKHGLAKPGEELVIVEDADARATTVATSAEDATSASNAAHWWEYFFDYGTFEARRTL